MGFRLPLLSLVSCLVLHLWLLLWWLLVVLLSKRNGEYAETRLLLPLMLSPLSHVELPVVICDVVVAAAIGVVVVVVCHGVINIAIEGVANLIVCAVVVAEVVLVAMVIYDEVTTAVVVKIIFATVVIRIVVITVEESLCLWWFRRQGGVELICLYGIFLFLCMVVVRFDFRCVVQG